MAVACSVIVARGGILEGREQSLDAVKVLEGSRSGSNFTTRTRLIVKESKPVAEQNSFSIFLNQNDKSNVVLIEETLCHIDSVIVSVVNVHFEALSLQLVHHLDLLSDKCSPGRPYTEVNGALLLSQLVLGLQIDHLRGDGAAIECDSDARRGILLHFEPLKV